MDHVEVRVVRLCALFLCRVVFFELSLCSVSRLFQAAQTLFLCRFRCPTR